MSFNVGKRTATLYQFTGKVVNASKNMETRVSGGGGGGFTYQGTGGSAPVNITSTTVVHDQLFIQNKDGEERSLQLQGFDLAVREGNIVTAVWAIPEGKTEGPYIAIINHSTNNRFVNDAKVKEVVYKCTRPINIDNNALGYLVLAVLGIGLAALTAGIGLVALIGYAIYYEWSIVRPKVKELKAHIQVPKPELW